MPDIKEYEGSPLVCLQQARKEDQGIVRINGITLRIEGLNSDAQLIYYYAKAKKAEAEKMIADYTKYLQLMMEKPFKVASRKEWAWARELRKGGDSRSTQRVYLIAAILADEQYITMNEVKKALEICDWYYPMYELEPEFRKAINLHALKVLCDVWVRGEELETIYDIMRKN